MKVADYTLAMQSSHDLSQQSSVKESLRILIDRPTPAAPLPPASSQVKLSAAAQAQQSDESAKIDAEASNVVSDPRLLLLISMVEMMTGQKVRVFNPSQLKAIQPVDVPDAAAAAPTADKQPASPPRAGYSVDYEKVSQYIESEQTTLQAAGIVKTSDGREIMFKLTLLMQRQYSETSSSAVHLGDSVRKDPLVINFNGTAAQLSEQRFAFDLNTDGTQQQINFTLPGSGFLALDLNADGKINNGAELFGPTTGNGFKELQKYDSDGNGWIDENDSVYHQLKVWSKDNDGKDNFSSLAALGVGAISLDSIATPFDLKTSSNQLLGSVRSSSVVLYENGSVSTVQQIDLTV